MKKIQIITGVVVILVISIASLQIFYFGRNERLLGHVGTYKVISCETWHSVSSLISNDARGGFYRIYDSEGKKVFELFSDTFAYDIVITSAQKAEFQLDASELKFWYPGN